MQTNYLRYFIDVATLGSMNAAAKKNYMTPQGISRSIASLETELGCELFQRNSNKVTLTRFGELLLDDARNIVERESAMRRTVIELHSETLQKRRMHITCYSSPIFFDTPLSFPLSSLSSASYGKVQFLQRNTDDVVDLLLDASRVSLPEIVTIGGFGFFSLFAERNARMIERLVGAGYEYRPLVHTTDYVLVPSYSPLAQETALSKAQIRTYPLAVAESGGMERAISRHIGAESIVVSSGDSAYRNHLCRMGAALTFVPGISLVFGTPEGTVAVPMQESYTIEVGFAARKSAFRKGWLADIIERLRSFYAEQGDGVTYQLLDGNPSSSLFT